MLKIASLNIEHHKHLEKIIPFFKAQALDVILLQEVLESDISTFETSLGMKSIFAPMNFFYQSHVEEKNQTKFGILTLTNLPIHYHAIHCYKGNAAELPHLKMGENPNFKNRVLLTVEILKKNIKYCVLNTHFTWTPDGKPNEQQFEDFASLQKYLNEIPEFILCGDLNAPRGTTIFDALAKRYQDNIPSYVKTTIDGSLHRAGPLNLVVDGLFTTHHYAIPKVEVIGGLSDHCAILAHVAINP